MNSNRKTATIVDVLFIIATTAALISLPLFAPYFNVKQSSKCVKL